MLSDNAETPLDRVDNRYNRKCVCNFIFLSFQQTIYYDSVTKAWAGINKYLSVYRTCFLVLDKRLL